MEGQLVCRKHGGMAPRAIARAEVRKAYKDFRFGNQEYVDPGESLLQLIATWHQRMVAVSEAVQELVEEHEGKLDKALVEDTYMTTADGRTVKVGEQARGLLQLENTYASMLAQWDVAAIRAKIEERKVMQLERNSAQFTTMMRALLASELLKLNAEQREQFPLALEQVIMKHDQAS